MLEFFRKAQHWLAGMRPIRRLLDAVFRNRARRRVAEFDQLSVTGCQKRTLLGLVHQAQATRFGRDHDFRRIRTADDFRRLVPVQTTATLWRDYWQPAYPSLGGATWPGPIFCVDAGPVVGADAPPYLALSEGLAAAHRTALVTALAFATQSRPDAARNPWCFVGPLCYGSDAMEFPPGSTEIFADRWDVSLGQTTANLHGPYALPLGTLLADDEIAPLAAHTARQDITCLAGSVGQLTRVFAQVKKETGRERLGTIWPNLAAVVYSGGAGDTDRIRLRSALGEVEALLLGAHLPPEGPVAVEDSRHGLLRLLPDHGVYFEFVPVEELGRPQPVRRAACEVEPGVPYALALTSPAGLWACLTGTRVCFESRDPPLLRLVDATPADGLAARPADTVPVSPAHSFPVQPPHPRNGIRTTDIPQRPGQIAAPVGRPPKP
jgi:hypothetical protein